MNYCWFSMEKSWSHASQERYPFFKRHGILERILHSRGGGRKCVLMMVSNTVQPYLKLLKSHSRGDQPSIPVRFNLDSSKLSRSLWQWDESETNSSEKKKTWILIVVTYRPFWDPIGYYVTTFASTSHCSAQDCFKKNGFKVTTSADKS